MGACAGKQRRRNHHGLSSSWAYNNRVCRHHIYEDKLVLDSLQALRNLREQEVPESFRLINYLAEEEEGWLSIVTSYVFVMRMNKPLTAEVISFVIDSTPAPSRKTLTKLLEMLDLSEDMNNSKLREKCGRSNTTMSTDILGNIALVIGLLAERFAGTMSNNFFTDGARDFLLSNLDPSRHESLILYSLLALEKFAITAQTKESLLLTDITQRIKTLEEAFENSVKPIRKQIHFCSQWLLDNIFLIKERPFSFENCLTSNLNVMLNSDDVGERLKISPNGLEARCDSMLFESVRSTHCLHSGIWFYEVTLVTEGVMQIGWATDESKFLNDEGFGVGDDEFSFGYDGCRQLLWHSADCRRHNQSRWKAGDVLGLLLDLQSWKISFYLNGVKCNETFRTKRKGFYAAASFMEMQQVEFNFGSKRFRFPPKDIDFQNMNDCAFLLPERKRILPKPLRKEMVSVSNFKAGSCMICFDCEATVQLLPCKHKDMCMNCALQCEVCPMCRSWIAIRQPLKKASQV